MPFLQPCLDDLGGETPASTRCRPGIAHARLGQYPCVKTNGHFKFLRPDTPPRARYVNAVLTEILEPHTAEIGSDIGSEVARRIMHLVEKLFLHGGFVNPSTGFRQLGDDRATVY